jgi:hypothetical protein
MLRTLSAPSPPGQTISHYRILEKLRGVLLYIVQHIAQRR